MDNKEIYVPLLPWLIGANRIGGKYNIYCASRGTSAEKGCMSADIFNYRIWIDRLQDDEETEIIKTAVYYGLESFENQNEENIETNIFSCNNEGLEEIKKWLEEKLEDFYSRYES